MGNHKFQLGRGKKYKSQDLNIYMHNCIYFYLFLFSSLQLAFIFCNFEDVFIIKGDFQHHHNYKAETYNGSFKSNMQRIKTNY